MPHLKNLRFPVNALAVFVAGLLPLDGIAAPVPSTVEETWASFDPRAEPLEVELIRETITDGIVLQN